MKRISLYFIAFLLGSFIAYIPAFAAADTYTIDPNHSYVEYHINHLGFSTQSGKWYANGTIIYDKADPKNDSVNVTINTANIVTGLPDLDKHLTSAEFFNVIQFPNATFVSDKVTITGKDTATIHGTLTVHGVAKPIILHAKLNQIGVNPITNKDSIGFSATTTVKRSDFGMTAFIPAVSDEVKLNIEAEAQKQ